MKTGMEMQEMYGELKRQADVRRDFKFPSDKLEMQMVPEQALESIVEMAQQPRDSITVLDELMSKIDVSDPEARKIPHLMLDGKQMFTIGKVTHDQLSARLKINKNYYTKMLDEAPELLATNVNHWLQANVERRMLRTLDGNARAFVSDRYRPIDNLDLLVAIAPAMGTAQVELKSCNVTETQMYIKAVSPRITAEVKLGDIVQAGILITNSEVGLGAVKVQPLIYRLSCLNGAIIPDKSLNKYHTGGGAAGMINGENNEWFKDDTLKAADKAFFMKVQDTVQGVLTQELFDGEIEKIKAATERRITAPVDDVVEEVGKRFSFSEEQEKMVLTNLAAAGDLTQWGLTNAVTLMSQQVEDYDRATEIEQAGGEIVTMSSGQWDAIATA